MRALFLVAVPLFLTTVCVKLSLSAKADFSVSSSRANLGGFECEFCDALVKSLEKYLEGDHTETEALAYMEQVSGHILCKKA